jgi:hypothetical protein
LKVALDITAVGYYGRGGGYGIGGILGAILIVVLILWPLSGRGYVGGF